MYVHVHDMHVAPYGIVSVCLEGVPSTVCTCNAIIE